MNNNTKRNAENDEKTISWSCNILGNKIDKYGSYKKKWNKKQKEKVEMGKKIRIDPN